MKYNVITGSVFSISAQHKLAHSVRLSTVVNIKLKKREFMKAIFLARQLNTMMLGY